MKMVNQFGKRTIGLLFPKFTEMQYFILISTLLLLLIFNQAARSEVLLFARSIPIESFNLATFFVWAVQFSILILLPIGLAIAMIISKKFNHKMSQVACTTYYTFYGVIALFSIEDQFKLYGEAASLLERINTFLTLFILIVIAVRWATMLVLLKLDEPKIESYFGERLATIQYHWAHFLFILASSGVILWGLQQHYTHLGTLAFLTISYTLVVLKISELLILRPRMPIVK